MSLTSYAAHFEDVLLWRALRHVAAGQYLDVGAGDPLQGSATALFYQHGWRGINLEPASAPLRQLRIARPADTNLALAAAAAAGEADFYEVSAAPLSTLDGTLARQYRAAGHEVVLRQTALETLDQVCAAHLEGTLHLLHLGLDDPAAALAGFELARWRPWLVVLRAPAGAEQPTLRAAGYTLAYQDGWKQYHVAPQQQTLAAALRLPPNPDDDWQLAEGHARAFPLDVWRQRTAAAEAEAATSRTWAMAHVEEWKVKHAQMEQQREQYEQQGEHYEQQLAQHEQQYRRAAQQHAEQQTALQGELQQLRAQSGTQLAELQADLKRVRAIADEQAARLEHDRQHYLEQRADMDRTLAEGRAQVAAVYASLSWRVTAPLRWAKRVMTRGPRWALRLPRRLRNAVVSSLKRRLGAALRYVDARPRLSFWLRSAVSRLPFLLPLARTVHMRLKHSQANPTPVSVAAPPVDAGIPADLSQLPDAARRMFHDLRRSAPHS